MAQFELPEAEGMDQISGDFSLDSVGQSQPAPEEQGLPLADYEMEAGEVIEEDSEEVASEEESSESQEAPSTLEVKALGRNHTFNLDPEDETLKKTLSYGVAAPKLKEKLNAARKELEEFKSGDYAQVKEQAEVWDQLSELKSKGHLEQVVQAVLGDEFEAFMESVRDEVITFHEGTPDERNELLQKKQNKVQEWKDEQARKRIEKLENELSSREEKVALDRLETTGTSMLRKYDMSQYVDDPDEASELNDTMWELAWTNVKKSLGDRDVQPSSVEIERAFARAARLLRGSRQKATDNAVAAKLEKKKTEAKKAAKTAATSKYTGSNDIKGKWDGRTAKSFFDLF